VKDAIEVNTIAGIFPSYHCDQPTAQPFISLVFFVTFVLLTAFVIMALFVGAVIVLYRVVLLMMLFCICLIISKSIAILSHNVF
jgi:hypothetical protein